jgi:hypothetical protein
MRRKGMRHAQWFALAAVVFSTGCKSEVKVNAQVDAGPPPAPEPIPEQPMPVTSDSGPTAKLPLGLGDAKCFGRPNRKKVELAMRVCGNQATRADLDELHQICKWEGDRECHHLTHRAMRVWNDRSVDRGPAGVSVCAVRSKEMLLATACQGKAGPDTLVDLIKRCKGNDRTCVKIAHQALETKNPALAKRYR